MSYGISHRLAWLIFNYDFYRVAAKLRRDQLSYDVIQSLSSDLFDQRLH
jgi:hypothetical protein